MGLIIEFDIKKSSIKLMIEIPKINSLYLVFMKKIY